MRIEFDVTPDMDAELERLRKATGLTTNELFQKGFTLLRIFCKAASLGYQIVMRAQGNEHEIVLPFPVNDPV